MTLGDADASSTPSETDQAPDQLVAKPGMANSQVQAQDHSNSTGEAGQNATVVTVKLDSEVQIGASTAAFLQRSLRLQGDAKVKADAGTLAGAKSASANAWLRRFNWAL